MTKKEKIVDYILKNYTKELEGKTEIDDLDLFVKISQDMEEVEIMEHVWLAKRGNDWEEWLSVEFYSDYLNKVIILTQEAFRSISGANSSELAGSFADILLEYESEAEDIEKMLERKTAEDQEEDIDINPKCRGFEK